MHLTQIVFRYIGVSAICNHSKLLEQRHLADNYFGVLSELIVYKTNKKYYEILTI